MSTVTMNLHDVTKVQVGAIGALPLNGLRIQTFTITAKDGSRSEINVFFDRGTTEANPVSFFDPE